MARRKDFNTRENYHRVLRAFRDAPGNISEVQRITGFNRQTLRKMWKIGWPKFAWAEPIEQVLLREANEIKARVHDQVVDQAAEKARREQEQADKAREEAVRQALAEGQGIRGMTTTGAVVFGAISPVISVFRPLADRIKRQVELEIASNTMTPERGLRIAREAMQLATMAADLVDRGVNLQRLKDEKPTAILGVQGIDSTEEEARGVFEQIARTIERAREAGMELDVEPLVKALPPGGQNGAGAQGTH